ncbi:hypothetical protein CW304_20705 [Bacillus sp. UFRGS-B20]|nr:hypothetical protein CW304_20705 [Bacillus sp. UFRGS-B20]
MVTNINLILFIFWPYYSFSLARYHFHFCRSPIVEVFPFDHTLEYPGLNLFLYFCAQYRSSSLIQKIYVDRFICLNIVPLFHCSLLWRLKWIRMYTSGMQHATLLCLKRISF